MSIYVCLCLLNVKTSINIYGMSICLSVSIECQNIYKYIYGMSIYVSVSIECQNIYKYIWNVYICLSVSNECQNI